MHLLALVEHPDHVCCRYRLRAFAPELRRHGIHLDLHTEPSWWQSLTHRLPRTDGLILQRRFPSSWEWHRLRRRYPILIFDFDDAVWLRDSYAPRGLHSARRLRRFRRLIEACDVIIAGNAFLADQAARYTTEDRIHIIPTCVDPSRYPMATHYDGPDLKLAWIGSSSTLKGLEIFAPTLDAIGWHVRGSKLKLICDRFLTLERLPVECCVWSEAQEASELATSDVGISWLPDDDWSRGKCGLKVLQYMAAGLPVVANRIGIHRELVRDGETGFLADSPDEWIEAVRALATDPDLRARMGLAGRQRVEQDFSLSRGIQGWRQALASRVQVAA